MNEVHDWIEQNLESMHGWCPISKAKWIVSYMHGSKPKLVVELGVWAGRSLIPMGLAMLQLNKEDPEHKGRVIGIDPYSLESAMEGDHRDEDRKWWETQDLEAIWAMCQEALEKSGAAVCTDLKIRASQDEVEVFADGSIDLLHIDGNHSELASVRDVELWLPKVSPFGIIILDDIDWPSVNNGTDF